MTIRKADASDSMLLAEMACQIWDHSPADLEPEFAALIRSDNTACFIAEQDEHAVGFAQCQLRHDYVEGTDTSPVGYLEGVWVHPDHQRHGFARELVQACEEWARTAGCTEFASDCELNNHSSLAFHLAVGFEEVNRIICFRKPL